jgi:PAS domain S-box-containing protein
MKNPIFDQVASTPKDISPETLEDYKKLVQQLRAGQLELKEKIGSITAEKDLAKNELSRHIQFYNDAPSGYFTLNREGIILELNLSASKFLGEQADQLKGRLLRDFLHVNSIPVFDEFLASIFKSQEKISSKVSLKSIYNIPANVQIEGISLPGKMQCLVDMVDISGRIKLLDQLAESEMRYQQLLESLEDGIGIVDLDENFIYSNPAGEQIFGVPKGELRNRNLKEFLNQDQLEVARNQSGKRELNEKSKYELEIITPEGEYKTLLVSGSPQYNRNGDVIGTFGQFTDITHKKKTEREIQRRLKLELIISEISNDFVHLKREYLDHSVNRALQKIGSFAEVDRSYVFLFSEDGLLCNNTHEWCEVNIEPQIENLQEIPNDMLPWWMEKLHNYETIHIPLVSNLPPEAQVEKEILEAQDIKSVLVIPLLTSNSLIGFLGFDSVAQAKTWQDEDILLLTMLGEILGNGFGRMKYEEDLMLINAQLEHKVEERTLELTQQLELNQAIVSAVPDLLLKLRDDGTFLEFYNKVNSSPIVPEETLIGKKIDEVLPENQARKSMEVLRKALQTHEVSKYEYQISTNGQTNYFENRIVAISENEALSIVRDITEGKMMESELRSSEDRWQFALEGSGDGLWDWNVQTSQVYFSSQWKSMLGYSDSEIENKLEEWEKRVWPEDLANCLHDLNNHLAGKTEIYVNEHRMLCKDGSYKWILDRGKVVERDTAGQAVRVIGTHTDITNRKLLEEQLKKGMEKEKELNDLKSRFVSTASHEFRTPLASILMVSDTLISYQHKMDQVQIADRLSKIKDHVLHLTNIVNDVLNLSRLQEGKIGFNPVVEDLVTICRNIIDGISVSVIHGQIKFTTAYQSLLISIDNRLIIQCISNLISNAIKYSEEDFQVEVELKQVENELLIAVSDHGIGIPERDQKHLFTPFFRAGNTSTIQGNGLGLSIVNESIQMHGGKVTFVSVPNQGSTFILHLPASLINSFRFEVED